MGTPKSAFQRLPGDDTLAASLRDLRIALQTELLRSGALWEESLSILREMGNHRRPFPSAAEALAWYRTPYHPTI